MATIIAEIRLAPGEVGYYDDYSRIYLNSARPSAYIYAGMNTTQIRRSIRSGRLRIGSGSLEAPAPAAPKQETKPAPAAKPAAAPVKEEEPVAEPEPVFVTGTVIGDVPEAQETETVAATAEEPVPEAVETEDKPEPAKRRRSRKKAE